MIIIIHVNSRLLDSSNNYVQNFFLYQSIVILHRGRTCIMWFSRWDDIVFLILNYYRTSTACSKSAWLLPNSGYLQSNQRHPAFIEGIIQ